jgi:hypothetical protein
MQNIIQGTKLDEQINPIYLENLLNNKDPHLKNYSERFFKGKLEQNIRSKLPIYRNFGT